MTTYKNILLSVLITFISGISLISAQVKEVIYLSGTDNTHTKTWEFFCTSGRNSGYWSTIEVHRTGSSRVLAIRKF